MRSLRFRAWHKTQKEMFDFGLSRLFEDSDSGNYQYYDSRFDNYEWMQSTGLLDKQGKEIYEGDIVKVSYPKDFDEEVQFWEGNMKVIWGKIGFSFDRYTLKEYKDSFLEEPSYVWAEETWEVIGNIYSDPNLLKEETPEYYHPDSENR